MAVKFLTSNVISVPDYFNFKHRPVKHRPIPQTGSSSRFYMLYLTPVAKSWIRLCGLSNVRHSPLDLFQETDSWHGRYVIDGSSAEFHLFRPCKIDLDL